MKANEVYQGKPRSGKAECTLTLSDDTFVDNGQWKTGWAEGM